MPIAEDIQALLDAVRQSPATFDPLKFLEDAKRFLEAASAKGAECDPAGPNFVAIQGPYWAVAETLSANGFAWASEQLLFGWWNDVGLRQLTEQKHIYRANSAYKLTQMYLHRGDRGAALRWALLTQADDLLSRHGGGGGAGKQWLRTTLGMTESELRVFAEIADTNLARSEADAEKAMPNLWFAEDLVVQLALKDIAYEHLFSQPSIVREFPISTAYLDALLSRVDSPNNSTKLKGDALEDLASYLFLLIPAWVPRRNVLDVNQGFETDIIVSNLNPESNLTADLLGRHFLVECKNWGDPVGVSDVGYFLHRMRLTHCNFGVIFAKDNISGGEKETAARSLIRRAFHEDGNTCIVLDRSDLEALAKGEITFWSMLLREIERFRFGKPKER